jgi:hypothetical protein
VSEPIRSFADTIAPVSTAAFFAANWETKPLHISRSQHDFYQQLLTRRDVDRAISSGGLRFPSIQLARGGRFLPAEAFSRNIRSGDDYFTGVPDIDALNAEYQTGATISLPGFHRAWEPLGKLAASIENEFSHAVHTNVYLTPGHTVGFTPHFDTHEVFILQIAGSKRWTIYQPPVLLPHRTQTFDARIYASAKPLLELDLVPGDLLYLPRGFVHGTATPDGFSVHATLGITVYTWVELLTDWAQSCRSSARFRRALPPGFAKNHDIADSLKHDFLQLIRELTQTTDHEAILEAFANRVRSARSMSPPQFDANKTSDGHKAPTATHGVALKSVGSSG